MQDFSFCSSPNSVASENITRLKYTLKSKNKPIMHRRWINEQTHYLNHLTRVTCKSLNVYSREEFYYSNVYSKTNAQISKKTENSCMVDITSVKVQRQNNNRPQEETVTKCRLWSQRWSLRCVKLTFLYQIVVMNRGTLSQTGYCRFLVSLSENNQSTFSHSN